MRNGFYEYKTKYLSSPVFVKAYNGELLYYSIAGVNGHIITYDYRGRITKERIEEEFDFVREVKTSHKWRLEYWLDGVKKETILRNSSFGLCKFKERELRRESYKKGLFVTAKEDIMMAMR